MVAIAAPQGEAVASRVAAIRERMAAAAARAGRSPAEITLVAVSKTFPPEHVRLAVQAGAYDLGENRVQEAAEKVPALPAEVRWHLVGHLQRNKVNAALDIFHLIHSVDTLDLAQAIGQRAARRGRPARILLQINIAEKDTQTGFTVVGLQEQAAALAAVPGVILDGLMCIAPEVEQVEETRPSFRRVAALHRELSGQMRQEGHPWAHLSMGMTNDFPIAIEEGATLVRVGRAVFGDCTAAAGLAH